MNQDYIHLWPAAMLTSALMLAFKCLNGEQARSSIDWEVYICIAFAFAVSTAIEDTKVALAIAQIFVKISKCYDSWYVICLIGSPCGQLVTRCRIVTAGERGSMHITTVQPLCIPFSYVIKLFSILSELVWQTHKLNMELCVTAWLA
jgi:hypothetical protein